MGATGTGDTIAASGQASFTGRVQKIGGWDRSVETLDDTGLDTSGYEEYCFGEIIKHGAIRVEVLTAALEQLPTLGLVQTWTISFSSGRGITGTAAIVASVSSEGAPNQRKTETFDIQIDGKTGPTQSDGG